MMQGSLAVLFPLEVCSLMSLEKLGVFNKHIDVKVLNKILFSFLLLNVPDLPQSSDCCRKRQNT